MDKYIRYANYLLSKNVAGQYSYIKEVRVLYIVKCIQDVIDSVRSKMINVYSAIDDVHDINMMANDYVVNQVCCLACEDLNNYLYHGKNLIDYK